MTQNVRATTELPLKEGGESQSPPSVESAIVCVSIVPTAIEGIWPKIEKMIRESVEWADFGPRIESTDDVRQKLLANKYELFVCLQGGTILAALIVSIAHHSRCSVLDIHYGAGHNMDLWIQPFYDLIIEQARQQGCRFIRIEGRAAWAKPLGKFGFKKAYTGFLLEI